MNTQAPKENGFSGNSGLTDKEENETSFNYDHLQCTVQYIQSRCKLRPSIGIVCGSGLGGLGNFINDAVTLPFTSLPYFPSVTVQGHKGSLVIGTISGIPVACFQGRLHHYEGHAAWKCGIPARVLHQLGAKFLIVTNAAGAMNTSYKPGDIVLIKDHIYWQGLAGENPLRGHNEERLGPRFPIMSNAYDKNLRVMMRKTAKKLGLPNIHPRSAVYCAVGGPQFETAAEVRMLLKLGVDLIGMSTALEVLVARHCGLKVLTISVVTNMCYGEDDSDDEEAVGTDIMDGNSNGNNSSHGESISVDSFAESCHDQVLEVSQSAEPTLVKLLHWLIPEMDKLSIHGDP